MCSGFMTDFAAQYETFRRRDPGLDGVRGGEDDGSVLPGVSVGTFRECLRLDSAERHGGLLGWSQQELAKCESVRGPDADRHAKVLTIIRLDGSKFGA